MTVQVTIQPSCHHFQLEEGETLLEGALRAGLNLNYHCNTGSCGECKGRVVSGTLGKRLHHDYVLSEAEKCEGTVLMCRTHAATDLVVVAGEAHGVADIPLQSIETQVIKMERPVEDILILYLRTPRSSTLRFLAGQYVTLHLDGLAPRSKSIASCPCNGRVLQFHVRRVAGDLFSEYVFNTLKLRQKVLVNGPYGEFLLDEESIRPIIFIAFETGFAPIKSLIEHAIALEQGQPMRLYWIARSAEDHYLANYCRAWQDALEDFQFHSLISEQASAGVEPMLSACGADLDGVERGMFQASAQVVTEIPDLHDFDVYVNGAEAVLEPMRRLLLGHGLPESRLFIDHVRRY